MTPPRGLWKDEIERPWISTQPLGLAYVAATARQAGHEVRIIDAYSMGTTTSDIRNTIKSFQPHVVGISSLTPQWPDARKLAGIVKQGASKVLTVVGGPHVTALPADAVSGPDVDVAVIGEGEETMRDICNAVAAGVDLETVPGLVIPGESGTVTTATRNRNMDLDGLPFPAHDLLPEPAFYNPFPAWGKSGNFSCIISGRGCPYNCCFCDVTGQQGKRYRLRSAGNIVDEMTWLYRDYAVTTFSFRDPSMICNRKRLLEICRLINERNLDIAWTCSARANEVDAEMLSAMKKAGCRLIQYGIEVGNAAMLEEIKNITREKVATAVQATRQAGISAHGYFLFGFVDETPETMQETIDFSREIGLDSAGFGVMVPFPGTQEFERYRAEGLLLTENWYDYDVMGKPVYRHKHVTREQLANAPRRAYRRFYLRPNIMLRHLRKMTSVRVMRNYLKSIRLMFN
ncbi:MAG: B12-binding domain-containing radical SAM protein [Thermoleophilia bacterium]